ncbi:MAG: hypothetical protein KAR40_00125 [Candidatus Sabulitectum sp.]|nr:hypothetical protein [Candidatus Sabulitectum sp.]
MFIHESGLVVKSYSIHGRELRASINKTALLSAIDTYLTAWSQEDRIGLPMPSRVEMSEYQIITPEVVYWEIWPLVFECNRSNCSRIQLYWKIDDIVTSPRCKHCGGRMRQLRYFSAHECGAIKKMHTPKCTIPEHGYKHVYFDDTGSFRTSVFRCRACNGSIIRRTLQSPCNCGAFPALDGRSMMRAYTVKDTRTYYPHHISMINFEATTYNQLQRHPEKGRISTAFYLGLVSSAGQAMEDFDRTSGISTRKSVDDWSDFENKLRASGVLTEDEIGNIKEVQGPLNIGVEALNNIDSKIIELGETTPLLERTILFDKSEIKRLTLLDAERMAEDRGSAVGAKKIREGAARASMLGIEEISVTWNFPIAMAAFGYTRSVKRRGQGRIRGFAKRNEYDGKTPIFTIASKTEAVLINLSAIRVFKWLQNLQLVASKVDPKNQLEARTEILNIFAQRESNPEPAKACETLVHSISHALLNTLNDGQIGFAETSIAEWIVPETLTFALYANNLKSFTLGAFWTLLNNRIVQWLNSSYEMIWSCENDPLCHQREPYACERCLYVTFGCPFFNDNLNRKVIQEFWRTSDE